MGLQDVTRIFPCDRHYIGRDQPFDPGRVSSPKSGLSGDLHCMRVRGAGQEILFNNGSVRTLAGAASNKICGTS
jgi:hypothetical protein